MSNLNVGSESVFRNDFLAGAARAFFVCAYADYCDMDDDEEVLTDEEREVKASLPRPGPGGDWYTCAPETPPNAYALAGELWASLFDATTPAGPYTLAERAKEADGKPVDSEAFGRDLAMMAMGTGVSWFDDHAKFALKVKSMDVGPFAFSVEAYNG